jgi:DNA-binding NtrC family response regulator
MSDPEPIDAVVLVADDDALVRSVLAMALSSRGITVVEAANMHEVRAVALSQSLDLVVLDINMPGGTVQDTLGTLRDEYPEVAILVLSGDFAPPGDLRLDANNFAHKPIDMDDLLLRVERLIQQSRVN